MIVLSVVFTSCAQNKAKETKEEVTTIKKEATVEHISNTDFKAKVEGKDVQLVDVRTPAEFAQGHLENAIMIDVKNADFIKNATEKLDKNKPVYVYCRSGHRSGISAEKLKEEGFTKVYDMKGGILGWQAANLKTVK